MARLAYLAVHAARRIAGKDDIAKVSRCGLRWVLDLREGLDLTIFLTGYFERGVVRACQRLLMPGDVAIDVGANMGSQTLHMAKAVGPTGRVLSVEPTACPMGRLRANLSENPNLLSRVRLIQAFLTSTPEDYVPEFLPSSWRLAGDRSGAHPIHRGVPQDTKGANPLTLDQLTEQEKLRKVNLIKIDVDGAEDDVIAGGERTIGFFRPYIVMEVAPYTLIERGISGKAPLHRLRRLGYVFEDLNGNRLDSEHLQWVDRIQQGYSRDIVACYAERNN